MELGDFSELKTLAVEVGSVFRMTMYPEDKVTPKKEGYNTSLWIYPTSALQGSGFLLPWLFFTYCCGKYCKFGIKLVDLPQNVLFI